MHKDTGHIYHTVDPQIAKQKGLVEVPAKDVDKVRFMNRKQRRQWAAEQRRAKR